MDAKPASIAEVFSGEKEYVVPVFQRNYKWGADKWKTLWHDIMAVIEEEDSDFSHFIGPMVIIAHVTGIDVPKYLVIDGQQRLMTLTILFAALRDRATALGYSSVADAIELNTLFFTPIKGNRRGKVVPRIRDRDALQVILSRKKAIDPKHPVNEAYQYFSNEIEQLTPTQMNLFDYQAPETILEGIYSAITQRVRAVMIGLDKGDNPSNIYESLNFKSDKLKDSELIKNYIFMQLSSLERQEEFDSAYWRSFDEKFSVFGVNQSDDVTDFYYRFLISKTKYFARARLYATFTKYVDSYLKDKGNKLEDLVAQLSLYADYYVSIKSKAKDPQLEAAFQRFRVINVDTAIPLLLTIFSLYEGDVETSNKISKPVFLLMLRTIESFILRRMILRERTRGYGEVFAEACTQATTLNKLTTYFAGRGWPTDEQVQKVMNEFEFYKREPMICPL